MSPAATLRADLIDLFATAKVADLVQSPAYKAFCECRGHEPGFDRERDLVETGRKRLEVLDESDTKNQIRGSLIELNKLTSDPDRQSVCHALICKAYSPGWSDDQRSYFEKSRTALRSSHQYFLSFTSRHHPPDKPNPINMRYKGFILLHCPEMARSVTLQKDNLLAEAIFRLLYDRIGGGFYYKRHEGNNRVVEDKLREACTATFVLIQLIQNAVFKAGPANGQGGEQKNYCFFEYKEARQAMSPDRILFVVAESSRESLEPVHQIPGEYDRWYQELIARDAIYLEETPYTGRAALALRDQLVRKLIPLVKRARDSVFDIAKIPS